MVEYVTYPLDDGFISNWLVAGPLAIPVNSEIGPDFEQGPGISGTPVERGPLDSGVFQAVGETGVWAYHACPADHFVDHSGTYPTHSYLLSWAYAEIVSDTPRAIDLELTTYGPAGAWVDGAPVFHSYDDGAIPPARAFRIQLDQAVTPVLVRFERMAFGETAHAMALRVMANGVHVRLPTLIADIGRRNAFEQLTAGVYVERDVYQGDTPIVLRWPAGERAFCPAHVRVHSADDSIYALADAAGEAGEAVQLGFALQLPAGPFRVTLMPSPDEVYLRHTRIFRHVPFWSMGRQRYRAVPAGDPRREPQDLAARRTEALLATAEYGDSLFGQCARMALGAWDDVQFDVLRQAIEAVRGCAHRSSVVLVGLLGMLYRWGDHPRFSVEVRQSLTGAIVRYSFRNADILGYAAEVLAGQRYPEHTFADDRSGAWHRANGIQHAVAWMSAFGSHGSAESGAADALADELVALSHLSDLADETHVYELAAVCTDKLLFTLALNSRQGVLASATRGGRASFLKSGYLQPTAGISRLLWGTGIYNQHAAGVVSLACAAGYDPPPILEAIAHDAPAELWSHERHAPPGAQPLEIDTYKTADYVLSSVRGLTPASQGVSECVWRVTLNAAAVVFANHPGSSSESDSRAPGYWAGNGRVPHVAQWRDVLIAMYRLPAGDVFGFTHAYFPCATFDDYAVDDGWAFARVGDGYLALANSHGLRMTSAGRYALRELKAFGGQQTWLVHMGRAALDGGFAQFQTRVRALPVAFADNAVGCSTLRGDALTLTWNGPLTVNAEPQPAQRSKHFENPYTTTNLPCTEMEIRHGQDYLRLDFAM